MLCIVDVDLEWVVLFIKYLSLKSRAMSMGVFKGHQRNDSHHIDLGTFRWPREMLWQLLKHLCICHVSLRDQ